MERANRRGVAIGISQVLWITVAILLFIVFAVSFTQKTGGVFG